MGSSTQVITPRHSILSRCSLTFGCKAMGHFLGACIMGCTSCQSQILYSSGNLPMRMNWSGNFFIKSLVDLMDLAAAGTVTGLTAAVAVETGAGHGGFVPGHMTVMVQFIFTSVSFSLEGRPRMAGPGVSAMYQYEFTWCGQAPGCGLAAKWWAHRVHHIGVYGICYRQWVGCWHDPGQWAGQLNWSGLDKDIKIHVGATHYLLLQCWPWHIVRQFPFCWHLQAAAQWCMPHCTVGHKHLLPLSLQDECFQWYHGWWHQWTAHHMQVLPWCCL